MGVLTYLARQAPSRGPLRTMAAGVLITTAGGGAWYTTWAIYFTRQAGIGIADVGIALFVAGAVGCLTPGPAGRLGDRIGHRDLLAVLLAVNGLGLAGYTLVHSFGLLLVIRVVETAAGQAAGGLKTAYVADLVPGEERTVELARQRTASHVGYAVGAAGGALCLTIDTRAAFIVVIVVNAATSLVYAAIVRRLPASGAPRRVAGRAPLRGSGLTIRFVAVAAATAVLCLCWGMVSTGLPLWLGDHTRLSTGLAGAVVALNSIGVAALQVSAGRWTRSVKTARRAVGVAGLSLAVACFLFATTQGAGGVWAVAVILCAALFHLVGEVLYIAAAWTITLHLTPSGRTGTYQGVAAAAQSVVQMVSPGLIGVLITGLAASGWLILAAVLVTAAVTSMCLLPRATAAVPGE
ncbi:MAG TPA: MFS transporter [Kutzneria sp.]|jgi:MFS family permease